MTNVTIVSLKELQIDFQMMFSDFSLVSIDPLNQNEIQVIFERDLFLDAKIGALIEFQSTMTRTVPRQMEPEFAANFN